MFQLTAMMAIFLMALVGCFTNLAGLLVISSVFQAASVLNLQFGAEVGTKVAVSGISPYSLLALFSAVVFFVQVLRERSLYIPQSVKLPFTLLCAYSVTAIVGAWFLPRWFEGMPVNLLLDRKGILSLSDLHPTLSNFAQILNVSVHFVVLLYFFQSVRKSTDKNRLVWGVFFALLMALGIGFYEQLAQFKGFPSLEPRLANNVGYEQAGVDLIGMLWARIGLPFSEPSYASAYFSAMTLGLWAVVFFGRGWWWVWVLALLSTVGLLNTLGSTGLVAAGLAMVILLLWSMINTLFITVRSGVRLRGLGICVIFVVVIIFGYRAYSISYNKPQIDSMVSGLILEKAKSTSDARDLSNKRAIEIVKETYGLGVGLGSNRASSFFASLISNTGVLGFFLFISMLFSLLWSYWRAPKLSDMQIFVAASLPTATLAMSLGIPDLNMPMYWIFIFLAFVFCPDAKQEEVLPNSKLLSCSVDPSARA